MKMQKNLNDSPEWVKDAICYQIFPDRFARAAAESGITNSEVEKTWGFSPYNSEKLEFWGRTPTNYNFFGGNLRGVMERLDYIQDLGCNTIYFCPIFASTANHRYHTYDYFRIDPLLGSECDFDALVKEMHERGMRIILDGVFNHCSRGFYPFNSVLESGKESPFVNWFHIERWPLNPYGSGKPGYQCWWDLKALPKFNTDHPQVREFLFSVAEFWIRRGIDGWRLDVPDEIDDDSFWREFRTRVRSINSEAWIVGEIWVDPTRWLQGDQFDGVMNYPVRQALVDFLFPREDERNRNKRTLTLEELAEELRSSLMHPQTPWMMNLPGSHDTRRIATLARKRKHSLYLIWIFYAFVPGVPCVYYGDEIALAGDKDPDCRRCFPWDEIKLWDEDLRAILQVAFRMRHEEEVLRKGDLKILTDKNCLVMQRRLGDHEADLRINMGEETVACSTIGNSAARQLSYRALREESLVKLDPKGWLLEVFNPKS